MKTSNFHLHHALETQNTQDALESDQLGPYSSPWNGVGQLECPHHLSSTPQSLQTPNMTRNLSNEQV